MLNVNTLWLDYFGITIFKDKRIIQSVKAIEFDPSTGDLLHDILLNLPNLAKITLDVDSDHQLTAVLPVLLQLTRLEKLNLRLCHIDPQIVPQILCYE